MIMFSSSVMPPVVPNYAGFEKRVYSSDYSASTDCSCSGVVSSVSRQRRS